MEIYAGGSRRPAYEKYELQLVLSYFFLGGGAGSWPGVWISGRNISRFSSVRSRLYRSAFLNNPIVQYVKYISLADSFDIVRVYRSFLKQAGGRHDGIDVYMK